MLLVWTYAGSVGRGPQAVGDDCGLGNRDIAKLTFSGVLTGVRAKFGLVPQGVCAKLGDTFCSGIHGSLGGHGGALGIVVGELSPGTP